MYFEISKPTWLGGRYGVLLLVIVVSMALVGVWAHQLWQGHQRAINAVETTSATLAHTIEDASSRTFQAIDLILASTAEGMKSGGWARGLHGNAFLESLLSEAPQVREVAYANATGQITEISHRPEIATLSIAAEPYFQQARLGKLPQLYISPPIAGRLLGDPASVDEATHQWHFIAARAVHDLNGTFEGVVIAVINPAFFQEQISTLDIGRNGYVEHYRYDGELMLRGSHDSFLVASENHADDPLFKDHLPAREWGTFHLTSNTPDGPDRIVSYRATSRWPLLVAVTMDMNEALAPWRREAESFTIIMGGGLFFILILSLVVYRQRAAAEHTEKQLTLLGAALKTSANMALITDVDATIVWVNDAFCHQFGYHFDEVIGKNPRFLKSNLMHSSVITDLWDTILNKRTWKGEFINMRKDGTLVIVDQTITPILNFHGRITHFVGIHDDITERKQAEQRLLEAKAAAEKANLAKSEFLAAMSHDLRTPLNAIMGFSDMMREQSFGPLGDTHYSEYANDIYNSGALLVSPINDILDLSKIEAGKYRLVDEPLDLTQTIHISTHQLKEMANSKNLSIHVGIPANMPKLYGDERALIQILNNLLSNAIKFSTHGTISILAKVDQFNAILLSVIDEGIGMSQTDIAKAMQPFDQADSLHSRRHEGTGLGLFLCANFMRLFDGTLTIDSAPGEGTTVTIRFPPTRTLNDLANVHPKAKLDTL